VLRFLGVCLVIVSASSLAMAQTKKVITHKDYEIWNSESGMTLSKDGQWICYMLSPPEGDRMLVIRHTVKSTEYRIHSDCPRCPGHSG
jgi:hypothetical protein